MPIDAASPCWSEKKTPAPVVGPHDITVRASEGVQFERRVANFRACVVVYTDRDVWYAPKVLHLSAFDCVYVFVCVCPLNVLFSNKLPVTRSVCLRNSDQRMRV